MNSRLTISNQFQLAQQAKILKDRAIQRGNRALLVVIDPPDLWLEAFARASGSHFFATDGKQDRSDRISALLGTERSMAVVQLGEAPDLGFLAALAGTVVAGGICIVGTRTHRPTGIDTHSHNITQAKSNHPDHSNRRLEKLASLVEKHYPETVRCIEIASGTQTTAETHNTGTQAMLVKSLNCCGPTIHDPAAKAEQDTLLAEACAHIETNSSSCVVIKGRRGRGKSSLLARLAMYLHAKGADFRITALHGSALRTFRKHVDFSLDHLHNSGLAITECTGDILLVDEAASLSIKQLQHYLSRYRHVVLCTTIEGYENSGRAFDIRLMANWSDPSMALKQLVAYKPWRWRDGDALEHFTDNLLLNKVSILPDHITTCTVATARKLAEDCRLVQVSQQNLANDESLLASIHSLLNDTHYQTTTKDLEHLLDAPTVEIWIHTLTDSVVGVLVLEHEGLIEQNLHQAIRLKQRRLPNQLLPQLLCQMTDNCAALERRYIRIVRLAVIPSLRRQGLASGLLNAVTAQCSVPSAESEEYSNQPVIDAIGASFAADASSVAFWRKHGYVEFHRGFRLNPRSGKQSSAVMRSFEPVTARVLSIASSILQDNNLARSLFSESIVELSSDWKPCPRDITLLRRFAAGQRSKHDSFAPLLRLSTTTNLSLQIKFGQSEKQHERELRTHVQAWFDARSL